jgi:hypothetical protein
MNVGIDEAKANIKPIYECRCNIWVLEEGRKKKTHHLEREGVHDETSDFPGKLTIREGGK